MAKRQGNADMRQVVQDMRREVEASQKARGVSTDREKRDAQLRAGKLNVVPFPSVATQPFRAERTIERASVFVSNSFKGDHFIREQTVTHPESGETVTSRLTVGKASPEGKGRGVLTQVHQDVFFKILQLWGEAGYPLVQGKGGEAYGELRITAYKLVQAICGGDAAAQYNRVRELLADLRSVPIVAEHVYTWQGLTDLEAFTLLDSVRWTERKVDRTTRLPTRGGSSQVILRLSDVVTEGFLKQHTKTLLGQPYFELGSKGKGRRSEIARLLYPYLDGQLSTKDSYRAKLAGLCERFGLASYKYKSKRAEKFQPAVRQLDGKLISTGRYALRVSLEESVDGSDWVLHARREPVKDS